MLGNNFLERYGSSKTFEISAEQISQFLLRKLRARVLFEKLKGSGVNFVGREAESFDGNIITIELDQKVGVFSTGFMRGKGAADNIRLTEELYDKEITKILGDFDAEIESEKGKLIRTIFDRCGEELVSALNKRFNENGNFRGVTDEVIRNLKLDEVVYVITAHPNGYLGIEVEEALREMLESFFYEEIDGVLHEASEKAILDRFSKVSALPFDKTGEVTRKKPELTVRSKRPNSDAVLETKIYTELPVISGFKSEDLSFIWNGLRNPETMDPAGERRRAAGWARRQYRRCGSYMDKYTVRANLTIGYRSIEELDRMSPPKMRSWVIGDADGKDATQEESIKAGIFEARKVVFDEYRLSVEDIISVLEANKEAFLSANLDKNQFTNLRHQYDLAIDRMRKIAERINGEIDAVNGGDIGTILTAKELLAELREVKEEFEKEGVVFGRARVVGGDETVPVTRYSKLDELYKNVSRCGDYLPRVEIRQNFRQHKESLQYIGNLLRENEIIGPSDDISENPEILMQKIRRDSRLLAQVRGLISTEYNRLNFRFDLANNDPGARAAFEDAKKDMTDEEIAEAEKPLTDDEKRARQILGFFELQFRYPGAISSYVIAESATPSEETRDRGNEGEIRDEVLVCAARDYRHLMLYEEIISGGRKIDSDDRTKFDLLLEDPNAILNAPEIWRHILTSDEAKDVRDRMLAEAKPVMVYDKRIDKERPMTVADYKAINGQQADITAKDKKTFVYHGPEMMFAGSDSAGRGTKAMAMIIGMMRRRIYRNSMQTPIKLDDGTDAVVIPKWHSGVGAGNPRSQGTVNSIASLTHVQTNQGLLVPFNMIDLSDTAFERQMLFAENRMGEKSRVNGDLSGEALKYPDHKDGRNFDLTEAQEYELMERCKAVVRGRMEMVYSPDYQDYLTQVTHADHAKFMNKSARKQVRKDTGDKAKEVYPTPVAFSGLRVIGFTDLDYNAGVCGTETQVYKFFNNKNGDVAANGLLSEGNRNQLLALHKNDSDIQRFFSETVTAIAYANYDEPWKRLGFKRSVSNGKVFVSKGGHTYSVDELSRNPGKFGAEVMVLAKHDLEYQGTKKALYELYFRMQHGGRSGELDSNLEATLLRNLKKIEKDPEIFYGIMPKHMAKAIKNKKEYADYARAKLTEDHLDRIAGGKGALTDKDIRFYVGSIHYVIQESGKIPVNERDLSATLPAPSQARQAAIR